MNKLLINLNPIYKLIKITSTDKELKNKDLIGFIGGTWTLCVLFKQKISKNLKK